MILWSNLPVNGFCLGVASSLRRGCFIPVPAANAVGWEKIGETNRGVVENKRGRPFGLPLFDAGRRSLALLFAFLLLLQELFLALRPFGRALDEFAAYEFEDAEFGTVALAGPEVGDAGVAAGSLAEARP